VLEDYIQTVEAAQARRDRLTAQIEPMLPDWTLAPVVAALQTMRGMALVNAATLIAELGDFSRFGNPRQLMAYLGLVPSEQSSGASVKRGGITKVGKRSGPPVADRGGLELPLPGAAQPRVAAAAGDQLTITAPVASQVYQIPVEEGEVVTPGLPFGALYWLIAGAERRRRSSERSGD
jgi:hypothetical protein